MSTLKANSPEAEFAVKMLKVRRDRNYNASRLPNLIYCIGCGDKISSGTLCASCQQLQNIGQLK